MLERLDRLRVNSEDGTKTTVVDIWAELDFGGGTMGSL